jgi:hypothetical protein
MIRGIDSGSPETKDPTAARGVATPSSRMRLSIPHGSLLTDEESETQGDNPTITDDGRPKRYAESLLRQELDHSWGQTPTQCSQEMRDTSSLSACSRGLCGCTRCNAIPFSRVRNLHDGDVQRCKRQLRTIIDSGATNHMFPHLSVFSSFQPLEERAHTAGKLESVEILGRGDTCL